MRINTQQKFFYMLFIIWLRPFFFIRAYNRKSYWRGRPLIVIANHVSMWDPFIIFAAMHTMLFWNRSWRMPTSYHFFDNKFINYFSRLIGCYPITPTGSVKDSLIDTIDFIRLGYSIIYFPEGKRVRQGEPSIVRKGIGYLIDNESVDILPVFIHYPNQFKPWLAEVHFGDVVNPIDLDIMNDSQKHLKVMNLIWMIRDKAVS